MRKKTLVGFLICMVLVALFIPTNADAYTKKGYVMSKASAKNFKIYINGSAKGFKSVIINGAKAWNPSPYLNTVSMGNDVKPNFTVSSSATNKGDVLAVCNTTYYKSNKLVAKNEITLYKGFRSLSNNHKIETVIHEFGHGFGLGHVKTRNAIMLDKGFINKTKPQTDDYNGIKAMYK
ncbi:matrixin family metalloprotease [Listeria marthii]|uniref:matrixin family metalloprotease n=1 Tax=Listeria marthii TaxID=529731 RepID=UPI001627E9C5|nr:matrixin family metalloprotease [Listeria marthii]MBC2101101.1 matrixin family metalloprotease [Listeria marthii]MBC2120724.1 matrixin family metalloprotease [Listeria marthii]MBF2556502.1 matrixin family metalloprotease [Listeria marthii]MBF2675504.1 matrixin family metalloprotease [Listeria marthii]